MLTSDIATLVKTRIGTRVTITDSSILDYVGEIEQTIKNYCNISIIPNELKYVWVNITTDYILSMSTESAEASSTEEQDVVGINLGGIGISFGNSDSVGKDMNKKSGALLVDFIKNYKEQLKSFRRIKWQ